MLLWLLLLSSWFYGVVCVCCVLVSFHWKWCVVWFGLLALFLFLCEENNVPFLRGRDIFALEIHSG